MTERIVPLELDCLPEAAVSGAILLESEYSTFLLFNAMKRQGEFRESAGLAVAEFDNCWITKFGYPNDEAWSAIPRTSGLSYGLFEVLESEWILEIDALNRHGFPNWAGLDHRHFLFLFHDSAFECIARDMSLTIAREPRATVLARLTARLDRD